MTKLLTWIVADLVLLVIVLAAAAWLLGWDSTSLFWTAVIWIAISVVWFGAEMFGGEKG